MTQQRLLVFLLFAVSAANPNWINVGRSVDDHLHTVTIAVTQKPSSSAACDSLLTKVSDPTSPTYGNYLSLEEIRSLFVQEESSQAVQSWLRRHQISFKLNINEDLISATAPISIWNNLLNADFQQYRSLDGGKIIQRTSSYTIPRELQDHVELIGHTTKFAPVRSLVTFHKSAQTGYVTPSTLRSVYNIPLTRAANPKTTQALFEAGQDFDPADVASFQSQFNIPSQPANVTYGPNDPTQCQLSLDNCAEATLDVEYIIAVAPGAATGFYFMNPYSSDPFLDYINLMSSTANPPLVHSFSYGSIATEDDKLDMARFNVEVCKLGLRGLTTVVAAGDDGVANYDARNNASACGFQPSYPATSPYVLTVGATQGPESGQPEKACMSNTGGIITTGGGFSYFFSRPKYQEEAVKQYFRSAPILPPHHMYNSEGRGYPDIAALGFNYDIVLGGQNLAVSGTSASCPVVAGMISLINDARLNAGKQPVGFVNPALYSLAKSQPSVFRDITVGENNCCAGSPPTVCCPYGFNATVGWDPLSGLGSPNFALLRSALLKL